MSVRKIIRIDEEKCDGCGQCALACAEGAIRIIDGKARLISDVYCDGLGACIGECPQGALEITEREAAEFDEKAVEDLLARKDSAEPCPDTLACGCPGSLVREIIPMARTAKTGPAPASALRNWPVQLRLLPVQAPFFDGARLLIAADCAGFALTGLHQQFLPGRTLIIACPKLDDTSDYEEKLAEIFKNNDIKAITLLYMTVPCCAGLVYLVEQALKRSGKAIPLKVVMIDPGGDVVEETRRQAAV